MADIGQTDFSLNPNVNIAAIASLYQKQATDQQTMALQQSDMQSQEQNRIINVMKMATDLTQNLIQTSANSQMRSAQKSLSTLMGQGNNQVPQMTPAASSIIPNLTQAPVMNSMQTAPQTTMFSQTPEYQATLRSLALKANPAAASADIASQQFPRAPTTTDQLLAASLMNNNQGLTNKITNAKAAEKPVKLPGMSSINRLMPDGTTHKIMVKSDGTEQDLGLIGTSTTNVAPAQVRNTAVVAKQVLPHFQEVRDLIEQADAKGLIGPTAGRVNQKFLTGKVGTTGNEEDDKLLGQLKTESNLLASAALKVHFGARGGQQMYEHFTKNLDTTFQSKALLEGELNGFESFLTSYANETPGATIPHPNPKVSTQSSGGIQLPGGFSYTVE